MPYAMFPARRRNLLLVTMGRSLTEAIYMDLYRAVARYEESDGPASVIADLSAVEDLDISEKFIRFIADMEPAVPVGMLRYAVASRPVVYGVARAVQTLRSLTKAPIEVVRSIGEAYQGFGVSSDEFSRAI